ncbi:flagellar brake protein [Clostridium ganghwense]|uniref:Flagellar brake domain-containing protein n=1 Tax=Clostridium ganghwense TaxID=312089 RepID=A0ABT4CMU3_9CLOT|nr:flagellar brake domain-containing protein [Clostridium ganghwense]
MSGIKFKINNKVEIIMDEQVYSCDVQDMKEGYLAISIPIKDTQYLPLRKGDRIEVLYYEGNSLYKFNSVVAVRKKANIPLIWITVPENYKKVQRRKFVRVSVLLNVKCAVIDKDFSLNKANISQLNFSEGTVVDLSGGGVRLKTKLKIGNNNMLLIALPLDKGGILIKGNVVRAEEDDIKNKICGINFIELQPAEQEKIIQYVFTIMREQMKKGLKED